MIKKSLMTAAIFLGSVNSFADVSTTDCMFSDNTFVHNSDASINLCNIIPATQAEKLLVLPNETHSDGATLFHVKQNKSSLAQVVTVVLFIPGLILLLFCRSTKSAK